MFIKRTFCICSIVIVCLMYAIPVFSAGEKKELEFVIVPKSTHPWFNVGRDGFAAASKELGFKWTYQAPAGYGGEAQAKLIENLIAQRVDGIAVAVVDPTVVKHAIDEAMANGIPVIAWNSGSEKSKQIMEIATDNYEAGVLQGNEFVKLMGGKPSNFVIAIPDLTGENLKQRVAGLRSVTSKHPELVELTSEQPNFQKIDKAVEVAQNLLTAYPKMDAYLDVAMVGAQGMVVVMKERKMKPGSIKQICWTNEPEIVTAVKEGYITGTLRQNPYAQGYLAAYGLKYYIDGKRPTAKMFGTGIVLLGKDNMLAIGEINKNKTHNELKKAFDKLWK